VPSPPTLAVTIATHNRRADLERTCAQLARLTPPADELRICADGCTDDTVTWVRAHVPQAILTSHPTPHGSIHSRDDMMRATGCDIVVGLDDDSYPVTIDFVAKVKAQFAARPRCAVLSFPQQTDEFPATLARHEFGPRQHVGSYVNAASAIRRAAFLALGGWPLAFEHMGDEVDFSLRCIAAGWDVLWEPSVVVRHHWSGTMRNELRNHHRHARNELWSVLLRCPSPWWPFLALRRAAGQLAYACRRGPRWLVHEPRWWWLFLRGAPAMWRARQPVEWPAYRRWLKLLRSPEPLD
jgi:GT2 family glycosyltransferase